MLPPFGWQAILDRWEFAPVVTAITVIAAALYLWGIRRVARRHPARPWPWWRAGMFLAGLAVVVLATESGIGAYDDVLFWDHMIQHLMLIMVAPPLLVVGQPATLLLHASRNPLHTWAKRLLRSRVVTFLTWPPFGLAPYAAIVGTHLTGLMSLVMRNPALHDGEHALYLVVGYLFFLPIIGREPIRWRVSYPVRLLILILAMPVDTFTGLVLGYASTGMPGMPAGLRPVGSPSPVEDVHWGGAVMWIGGDAIMFVFMMVVFLMWSRNELADTRAQGWLEAVRKSNFNELVASHAAAPEEPSRAGETSGASVPQAAAKTASTSGGIDDDEHLAAYNAYLARLNQPGRGPDGHR
jgi:putative copper resistance protein D